MRTDRYDLVIIGSGAGGGTIAHALADSPARVLILERGDFVPQEPENWNPEAVWKHLRYQAGERWLTDKGQEFRPYTHYNVGGNTKFWGSVLYRLRREDFQALEHMDGVSPAWPIDYDTLAPYYDRAERLYHVHGEAGTDPTEPPRGAFPYAPIPHSDGMAAIVDQLRRQGLHPSSLPLGIRDGCVLCNTCNSFACQIHAKSDAEVCCVRPARERQNVELWTNAYATRLLTNASGGTIAAEVDGGTRRSNHPVCILVQHRSAALTRPANDKHHWTGSRIGRRYMAHLATMMQGFHPFRKNASVFQKTVAINDFYLRGPDAPYPLGQIQSQGAPRRVAQTVVPQPPLSARLVGARGRLAAMSDLERRQPHHGGSHRRIRLNYRPNTLELHLVKETRRILHRLGFWVVITHSHGSKNTTHQCGTLVFGADPRHSVLDLHCRAHDVENLFVVDASFFPSAAAVNPGLTIIAQALRVATTLRHCIIGDWD
jgi:choline dehydrogenase-like flavoprotein